MNKEKICVVRGVFTNIYRWGEGWDKKVAMDWDEFLEKYKGIFWKTVKVKDIWYLVGVQGSIYLHPMDFQTVLRSSGGCCSKGNNDMLEDYFGEELDELKELCTQLAKCCGGQFTSMVAEAQTIENNNLRQLLKEEK